MNLLPCPRELRRGRGFFRLPSRALLQLDASLPGEVATAIAKRLQSATSLIGVKLTMSRGSRRRQRRSTMQADEAALISFVRNRQRLLTSSPALREEQGYELTVRPRGIVVEFGEVPGLRAAVATLRQLLREYGRRLPCLMIRDWPDFARRGVMLDVSRGRVPKLETLLELVDHLADFKINEFQLYLEHTFAYRHYRPVWHDWGALTAAEIRKLDARCRELGIDLVPNQNSFGHLRAWLEYLPLKKLGEVAEAYESGDGSFLRYPSTLAPNHPGTLPFLRGLYDELLPNFSSRFFNVGCDETWDLGRGQSKALCKRKGKGRVYLAFLKKIHREVARRGRRMMFWGDIILRYPELICELPGNVVALDWGYEAKHPFDREARLFAKSGRPFYVCPGTSTWMTLIGRHDNALANLRAAARAGRKHGALGYLITDWGDGGHPQPLAVSYLPYLAGAALSWCAESFECADRGAGLRPGVLWQSVDPNPPDRRSALRLMGRILVSVLSRDIFSDPTGQLARSALALGLAHRKFCHTEPNSTPFGAVIAAPPPERRELFCRNGLKLHSLIAGKNIRAALAEVEMLGRGVRRSRPETHGGEVLKRELGLAARMAAQSCRFMLWQQAVAAGDVSRISRLARTALHELRTIERDFNALWPLRNKGTPGKCSAFLGWRRHTMSACAANALHQ